MSSTPGKFSLTTSMSFSSFLRALVLRVTALVPSKVLAARLRWAFLPGPSAEDEVAYNTDNHKHLTALHEQYGDTFVARRRNGKKVLFVRSPASVRGVLLSEHFGKVWATQHPRHYDFVPISLAVLPR